MSTAESLPILSLQQLRRWIASHDIGQQIAPRIVGDCVEFDCAWFNSTTQEYGHETLRAKTLKQARDLLGY